MKINYRENMKFYLLYLFLISILLSRPESIVYGGTLSLKQATKIVNDQSQQLIRDPSSKNAEILTQSLRNNMSYLTVLPEGNININEFRQNTLIVQNFFIDTWGITADAISKAAYKPYNFDLSAALFETHGLNLHNPPNNPPTIFKYLADKVKLCEVIQILQRHLNLKPGEDPTVIFKNIYYTLLYQWLTYTALDLTQHSNNPSIDLLKWIIQEYTAYFNIDTQDSKLMNELERQQQILVKLLEVKILPKSKDQLTAYLQLVRDYMLGVVIPPIQLEPPIKLFSEQEAEEIKRANLKTLSERLKSTDLPEDNSLRKMVAQDLGQRQPKPATLQALLGYLTNLSTQLTQLHTSITH